MTSLPLRALRRGTLVAIAVSLALLLVACGDGTPPAVPDPVNDGPAADGAISVSANNLEFDTDRIEAPAGETIVIEFTNHESAPHNIAIYTDESRQEQLFEGEIISGPDASVTYEIPAMEAGEYYFLCSVHPEMNGAFIVED